MNYVLIIHEVEDYQAWKQIFDRAATIRKAAGERAYQVLKYTNDSNKIVHFSEWTSIQAARKFFESPELSGAENFLVSNTTLSRKGWFLQKQKVTTFEN